MFTSATQASEIIAGALSISCYSEKVIELKGEALFQGCVFIGLLRSRKTDKVTFHGLLGTLLPVSSTFNVVDTDSRTISSTQDDAEANEIIICLEDRLRAEGILGSDEDSM
ncbi:hypothetical protein Tco_0848374 [Tanacetum coccineum]